MLGMAWLTFRAGSTYQHFKNADKLVSEGRGSFSSGEEPEMIRRLKFQTLIWYIANCVVLALSTIVLGIYFIYFTVNQTRRYFYARESGTSNN